MDLSNLDLTVLFVPRRDKANVFNRIVYIEYIFFNNKVLVFFG